MRKATISAAACVFLAGCASIPDVSYRYYPAIWDATVTATQAITCDNGKTSLIVAPTMKVTPTYSANRESPLYSFELKQLDKYTASVEMTMTLTEDGRLKSINQSTVGAGEDIVKSAVGLLVTVATVGMKIAAVPGEVVKTDCEIIDTFGDPKTKVLTLSYEAKLNADMFKNGALAPGVTAEFKPTDQSATPVYLMRLNKHLPVFVLEVSKIDAGKSGVIAMNPNDSDFVPLKVQRTGALTSTVKMITPTDYGTPLTSVTGTASINIPLPDDPYTMPIPKAALFGTQNFSLTLADSGAIQSVSYSNKPATAGALNSANAVAGYTQARLKAEADLDAARTKVQQCRDTPASCK